MNFGPFIDRYFNMFWETGSIVLEVISMSADCRLAESKPDDYADYAELPARVELPDSLLTSSVAMYCISGRDDLALL